MSHEHLKSFIESAFEHASEITPKTKGVVRDAVDETLDLLDKGEARVAEKVDGQWVADSPMGRIVVAFAPGNDFGVLDHDVTLPSGQTIHNPMRVIQDGEGSEVVFTLRRRPELTDAAFAADAEAVQADLRSLKQRLEQ